MFAKSLALSLSLNNADAKDAVVWPPFTICNPVISDINGTLSTFSIFMPDAVAAIPLL